MPIITLLTDFGTVDAYVAQMKGQILSICPSATLVDIAHTVPAQDVAYGSLLLAQAVPYFPNNTVHIAVVDPGVGTARDILAIELECDVPGSRRATLQRLVLPDNGLAGWIARSSRVRAMHRVTETRYWNQHVSSTFHGRDIMGPVAAYWASGKSIDAFGPICPEMKSFSWPSAERLDSPTGTIRGTVIAADHFGNLITNVPADWLATDPPKSHYRVCVDGQEMSLPRGQTYGEFAESQAMLLIGSHGFVELAVVAGNASKTLGTTRGAKIDIACL